MVDFSFQLEKTVGKARAGTMQTGHGPVQTPIFMPVGTQGTVKALDSADITGTQAQIILANTYHLFLRPGTDRLERLGGLHHFMNWQQPILTDSGGFQVFSLSQQLAGTSQDELRKHHEEGKLPNIQSHNLVAITDEGVSFTSHLDGSRHFFSPERAIELQRQIGPDIMMMFDECTPDQATPEYARQALDRTHRWAEQCVAYWQQHGRLNSYGHYQALFGIVQGALIENLRRESVVSNT